MERKQLEDLIQRLWDQGASIEIMKILEHDKQQRETLSRAQGERDEFKMLFESMQDNSMGHAKDVAEALGLLSGIQYSKSYAELESFMPQVDDFIVRNRDPSKQR